MASQYVERLNAAAEITEAAGFPVTSEHIRDSARRMERMEILICDLIDEVGPEYVERLNETAQG